MIEALVANRGLSHEYATKVALQLERLNEDALADAIYGLTEFDNPNGPTPLTQFVDDLTEIKGTITSVMNNVTVLMTDPKRKEGNDGTQDQDGQQADREGED